MVGERDLTSFLSRHYGVPSINLDEFEIDDEIRCVDVASGYVVTSRAFGVADVAAESDELVGPTGWKGRP
jgi:hypothetical protein